MFDGVGRRRDQSTGQLVNIGNQSLNGNEHNILFRNNSDGTFSDVAYCNQADRREDGRGLSIFDYDLDGNLDILMRNYKQSAQLLRNSGSGGNWLKVKLIGSRSNRDGIGARVTVITEPRKQIREVHAGSSYLSSSSLIQHFGLGTSDSVDVLRVEWPSGSQTLWSNVSVNQLLEVHEDLP